VLVNNAAYYDFGSYDSITEEGFHRHFDTNVLGPILATQEAVKLFGADGGAIINLSSIVAIEPTPYALVYSATKAAIDNITSTLSKELGPKKIRVNAILPGMTLTEGLARIGAAESEMGAAMLARTPLGRHGQPADIAGVAVFLGSPESNWITGETIRVSGGLH
jgi:3-oxoacyl-[acyl-carrier protein] reductase